MLQKGEKSEVPQKTVRLKITTKEKNFDGKSSKFEAVLPSSSAQDVAYCFSCV